MATEKETKDFIKKIAPIIKKAAKKNGYKVASPIIAQACIESAWGKSLLASKYHNYFGMKCGSSWKGGSVNMQTKEEYKAGKLTTIRDNFRTYKDMESGVQGYFDFIKADRYKNLKGAKTAKEYLELIKKDGYATSSSYVSTNMTVVKKYNLTEWDKEKKKEKKKETAAKTHTVKKGDTLSAIAKKYKVKVADIVALNKKKYPKITKDFIVVGWKLTVKK